MNQVQPRAVLEKPPRTPPGAFQNTPWDKQGASPGKDRRALAKKQSLRASIDKYFVDIWNVPNVLTMLRLVLIPVFVAFYCTGHEKWAFITFVTASVTDFLDGYLARKHNQITAFGKLMDPLADKVMVLTALLCQTITGIFPLVAFIIVMCKELMMIIGGAFMLRRDIVVYSNMLGKSAQVAFIAALILSFWHKEFTAIAVPVDTWVLWLAVALALIAMVDYAVDAVKKLRAQK